MSSSAADILGLIKQNSAKFIDFRFTDMFGSCYHETYKADASEIESILEKGLSIKGRCTASTYMYANATLLPDLDTAFLDPFCAQSTLVILCDIMRRGITGDSEKHPDDPRAIAKRAHEYMLKTGIADQARFSPEVEFHIFDDVKYHSSKYSSHFKLDLIGENSVIGQNHIQDSADMRLKNMMIPPNDPLHDIRSEILEMMSEVGMKPLSHYLAAAPFLCGIGFESDEFLYSADSVQKFKYIVRSVASSYGKTATFMPSPITKCEKSNMYCSQSLWKGDVNLFVGQNNQVSETCLYYIGGIMKHGQAINAYTNPTTNSYASSLRYQHIGYSYNNSSFVPAILVLHNKNIIQVCFPDAIANPYLCFTVQLMAGLDGIKNKIHPGDALDELSESEEKGLHMSQSLQDALDALDKDREFLLQGNVFTKEQIDQHIQMKKREVYGKELAVNPIEFANYYNL